MCPYLWHASGLLDDPATPPPNPRAAVIRLIGMNTYQWAWGLGFSGTMPNLLGDLSERSAMRKARFLRVPSAHETWTSWRLDRVHQRRLASDHATRRPRWQPHECRASRSSCGGHVVRARGVVAGRLRCGHGDLRDAQSETLTCWHSMRWHVWALSFRKKFEIGGSRTIGIQAQFSDRASRRAELPTRRRARDLVNSGDGSFTVRWKRSRRRRSSRCCGPKVGLRMIVGRSLAPLNVSSGTLQGRRTSDQAECRRDENLRREDAATSLRMVRRRPAISPSLAMSISGSTAAPLGCGMRCSSLQ
jgi:hypothetical protein